MQASIGNPVCSMDYWDVYQSIIRECKNALDAAEISIPFPQMDVHLDDPVIKAMGNR